MSLSSPVPDKPHPYFGGIQDLRGWAALLVVFYHAHVLFAKDKYFGVELFGGLFAFGHRGVELFFVISGFLMAMLLKNGGHRSPLSFFYARARRIYIPYLPVSLALTSVCVFAASTCPAAYAIDGLTLLQNILIWPRENMDTYVPVVAWSLSHEIFFYLLVFLAILFRTSGRRLLYVWLAISVSLTVANVSLVFPWAFIFSPYNSAFAAGMLAFYLTGPGIPLKFNGLIRFSGLALFVVFGLVENMSMGNLTPAFERVLMVGFFLASFLLVLGFAAAPSRRLGLVGNASYSLYLVHYPALVIACMLAKRFIGDQNPYLLFLLAVSASLVAGFLYFYLIERPSLALIGGGNGRCRSAGA